MRRSVFWGTTFWAMLILVLFLWVKSLWPQTKFYLDPTKDVTMFWHDPNNPKCQAYEVHLIEGWIKLISNPADTFLHLQKADMPDSGSYFVRAWRDNLISDPSDTITGIFTPMPIVEFQAVNFTAKQLWNASAKSGNVALPDTFRIAFYGGEFWGFGSLTLAVNVPAGNYEIVTLSSGDPRCIFTVNDYPVPLTAERLPRKMAITFLGGEARLVFKMTKNDGNIYGLTIQKPGGAAQKPMKVTFPKFENK